MKTYFIFSFIVLAMLFATGCGSGGDEPVFDNQLTYTGNPSPKKPVSPTQVSGKYDSLVLLDAEIGLYDLAPSYFDWQCPLEESTSMVIYFDNANDLVLENFLSLHGASAVIHLSSNSGFLEGEIVTGITTVGEWDVPYSVQILNLGTVIHVVAGFDLPNGKNPVCHTAASKDTTSDSASSTGDDEKSADDEKSREVVNSSVISEEEKQAIIEAIVTMNQAKDPEEKPFKISLPEEGTRVDDGRTDAEDSPPPDAFEFPGAADNSRGK